MEPHVVGLVLPATGHDGPDPPSEQARVGGVPTVADSVPTAAMYLEQKADLRFHPQSNLDHGCAVKVVAHHVDPTSAGSCYTCSGG